MAYKFDFDRCLKKCESSELTFGMALHHAITPFLEINLRLLQECYDSSNTLYLQRMKDVIKPRHRLGAELDDPKTEMEGIRFALRRGVCHYEQCMSGYKRYLRKQGVTRPDSYEELIRLNQGAQKCLNSAHSLEAEIRD